MYHSTGGPTTGKVSEIRTSWNLDARFRGMRVFRQPVYSLPPEVTASDASVGTRRRFAAFGPIDRRNRLSYQDEEPAFHDGSWAAGPA